ncbi:hypothetical protein QVD17_37785 [Tagetes erecta]|uniref:Uncharacterized protein n=1 Tax=Tagetes erecta TaxID=13708 RepID=A0AAD8JWM2_TARER|nr:hypothetical protein QVD17_37785 [Tagetes erecta]
MPSSNFGCCLDLMGVERSQLFRFGEINVAGCVAVRFGLNRPDTDEEACELVNGVEVLIGEGDDDVGVAAYLLTVVKNNNGTGALLLYDI